MYTEKEASAETYVTCLHLVPVDINQKWTSVYLQLTAGLRGDAEWGGAGGALFGKTEVSCKKPH